MALQVWLPLNGTLENKGLSNVKMVSTDAPIYTDNGKIGKAIVFLNNINTTIRDSNVCQDLKYTDNFSYCMWVKNVSKGTASSSYLFTVGRADAGSRGYGIRIDSATSLYFMFGDLGVNKTIVNELWNFIAFVKKGNTLTYYINGVSSTATFSGTLPTYTSSEYGSLGLGCFHYSGNIYQSNATINDFRIYNHALSEKEVKEISKGLILHYKLDGNDIGITIPRNSGLIPDGVELYEYLLSSGTLYILTTILPTSVTEIEVTFSYGNDGRTDRYIFSNWDSSNAVFGINVNNNNLRVFKYTTNDRYQETLTANIKHTIKVTQNAVIVNGVSSSFTGGTFPSSFNRKMILFGDTPTYLCPATIYEAKRWENGILINHFVPCTYLGEPGMWDTVENKFYRNQGTGLFTLGNKITLKEYEYLSATKGPYINTGYCHSATTSIDLDAAFNTLYSYNTLLGAATSDNSSDSFCFGTQANGGLNCDLTRGFNVISGTAGKLTAGTRFNVKLDVTKAILNGVTYTTGVTTGRACQYTMAIFGRNLSNSYSSEIGDGKVYELKIYDSPGVLVRDYVPVSYNGTPGLWDKVEWKFYANAGSGSFTLGPEKTVQQDAPIFYDSSGYCNHGSITGTLLVSNDSARYINSCLFSATESNYIRTPSQCLVGPYSSQALTFSFWINPQQKGNRHMIFGSASNYALNIEFTAANALRVYLNGSPDYHSFTCNNNEWTHVVIVITTNIKCYKNGVLLGTSGAASWPGFSGDMLIGSDTRIETFFLGSKMSDFRIYATALSEDDIKELYNTSAFVTNNGVFAEYELYEDNLSDVKKRGLLETANFYENGAESGYALDTDKTRVASNYIISEDFIEI